jgi:hypothetical protein
MRGHQDATEVTYAQTHRHTYTQVYLDPADMSHYVSLSIPTSLPSLHPRPRRNPRDRPPCAAQLLVTQPPTLSHSLPLAQSKGESVFEDSDLHVRLPGGVENLNAPLFALPGLGKQGAAGSEANPPRCRAGAHIRKRPAGRRGALLERKLEFAPVHMSDFLGGAAAAVGHLSTCRPRCPRGHCCIQPVFAFTSVAGYAGPSSSLRTH